MSVEDLTKPRATDRPNGAVPDGAAPERLSLGVAARMARYLQVLTKAKKEGKETISSQELSAFTQVNSTQIRRDLSGFGKFGKRGVGYNVDRHWRIDLDGRYYGTTNPGAYTNNDISLMLGASYKF